jgi:hypothetical protein
MTFWALLCAVGVVANFSADLFFAESRSVQVWLGFETRGWVALATAPIHWAIFGVGAWGFWTQRTWIAPSAAAYLFYVALSYLIWSEVNPDGRGWPIGLLQAAAISTVAILLLRAARVTPVSTGA